MNLLSSGAFQARTRLSAKALRLYGDKGLLVPAHVDPYNRYRYYSEEQVEDARLINMLRGLDMPLHLIAKVLNCTGTEREAAILSYWDGVEEELASRRYLASYVDDVPDRAQEGKSGTSSRIHPGFLRAADALGGTLRRVGRTVDHHLPQRGQRR